MVSIGNYIKREAGLLLLGGIIFGSSSMLKAAEKYVDDPNDAAIRYYNIFCHEVQSEIDKRRNDLRYADKMYMLDRMLEETIFPYGLSYDTTIEYRDEMENFVTDIMKDAMTAALKETDIYRDVTNDLQSNLRGLFGLPEVHNARTPGPGVYPDGHVCTQGLSQEPYVKPQSSSDEGVGNGLLGYGDMDTGIRTSASSDELRLSAYAKFEDLKLLGGRFERGRVEVGTRDNGRLRASLENALSKEMRYRIQFKVENMENPSADVSVGITGGKKSRWVFTAGYHDGGPGDGVGNGVYATAGLITRF